MSEPIEVDGYTVTPQSGGYYLISHPTMMVDEKVRGKEAALARVEELKAPDDGSIPQMPPVDEALEQAAQAQVSGTTQEDDRIARLEELVLKQSAQLQALLAAQSTTVVADAPAPDPFATMPQAFRGQVDKQTRAKAKAMGVEYVTIVLEEGNDIPPTGLFLQHNFRPYMISPGEPVDVPDFLLEVLDHAVMSAPVTDPRTNKVLGYRNRMRYPYRRV